MKREKWAARRFLIHFHIFFQFPELLQFPLRVLSFNQGIQKYNEDFQVVMQKIFASS